MAGGSFSKVFAKTNSIESPNILHLGYVTNEQLRALYENATAFVFPSLYEGFGLPPLEAMACGCPVLCSNRASLPEVCGDAALYFDPMNTPEIISRISELMGNPELQSALKAKGWEQASLYTWEQAARQLVEAILSAA